MLFRSAAVREAAGVFDVSHLGKALVSGPGAADFVNSTLTNDLGKIRPGKAQYTLCCNETGGAIDDLIAYLVGDDEVFLVPNAANTATVVAALRAVAPEGITIADQHRDYAVFAVQGPRAPEVLDALGLPSDMEYMAFADADLTLPEGVAPVRVCRTGYTGERGFEILPRWAEAGEVFDALLAQVTAVGGLPAGLGARDLAAEVRALLQKLESEQRVDDPFGKAAATVACHASVRAGMLLSMEEMRRLVEDLERTASPRTCPHGRPTLVHLGTDAIERQFGRR